MDNKLIEEKTNEKLKLLIENINISTSFQDTLNFIYELFSDVIPYSHIGIALLQEDEMEIEASYGISAPSLNDLAKKLYGIKEKLKNTSLQEVLNNQQPRIINDLPTRIKDSDKSYNKILLEAGIKSSITYPLKISNKNVGIIFFSSKYKDVYTETHVKFLKTISSALAISLNKNLIIDELLLSTVLSLAKIAEARDEDTGDHIDRMKSYAIQVSKFLVDDHLYYDELTLSLLRDIGRFSPMHDIGKVGIRDDILLKPGKLTKEEFENMKTHTTYGANVLIAAEKNINKSGISLFKVAIEIAESHHEKWNGSGYPKGKSGEDIPLSARIVAVADVFDALTSKRPYKEAFSFDESFNILVEGRGKHFDPNIIESLIKHKDEFYELYTELN